MFPTILAEATRGQWVENRHAGWVAVSDTSGNLLYSTPDSEDVATFFRSSAKPFQAYPIVEDGYHDQLADEELAVICASHTASTDHVRWVQSLLQKAEADVSALQCGPHAPIDDAMRAELKARDETPSRLHNNCSGKHAGMLYWCHRAGVDASHYLEGSHPLQQRILETLKRYAGLSAQPEWGIDGCGAPTFYLPLTGMARLFANLGAAPEFSPLAQAMRQHPTLVGGHHRIDTELMLATRGRLLAKVGADGVMGISRPDSAEGLALKIADGSNDARNCATLAILLHLNWLTPEEAASPGLAAFWPVVRRNTLDQTVGTLRGVPPAKAGKPN
jgi:L-asparaginase II